MYSSLVVLYPVHLRRPEENKKNKKDGAIRTHYPVENLAAVQGRTSHTLNRYKEHRNGLSSFQFCYYREFKLLNDEEK